MRTILLFTILTVINEHAARELKRRDVLVPYKWKTNPNLLRIGNLSRCANARQALYLLKHLAITLASALLISWDS